MALILHMARRADWDAARSSGSYRVESLDSEGFIHCSTPAQLVATANRFQHGRRDLVLLCIDPALVQVDVIYEGKLGGEQYPHIYGPLNVDAVARVLDFPPNEDGSFSLPPELA